MAVFLSPVGGAAAQFFTNSGVILSGGKLYSYAAGTTTPQATYTSSSGITAHTNPIILDSAGRVPGGEIWLTSGISYKFVLKDSNDVLISTYDNITGINGTGIASNATNVQYDPPFTGGVSTTVAAKLAQYVSVVDFGAVGDDSNDDTSAIQTALNYCFNTGGGGVYIPAGNWKTTSPLIVRTNTCLYGSGPGTIIHGTGGSGSPSGNVVHLGYGYEWNQNGQYFNPSSNNDATLTQLLAYDYSKITTSNVRVTNMTVKSSTNGLGVWTMNCQNAQIDNLWFINTLTPVNVANDASGWQCASHNVNVSDIWQVSATGVNDWYDIGFCGSATNVVFTRCYNNPKTPSNLDSIIQTNGTHDMVVTNCTFSMETVTDKVGITYTGTGNTISHNTMVSNCVFKNLSNGVVFFDIKKGVCTSNTFDSCSRGISLLAKSCLIENNMFLNNTTDIFGNGDATDHVIQDNIISTIVNNDIDFESYNVFRDNTNGSPPNSSTNVYSPLYQRTTVIVPFEGFVDVTQLANVTVKGTAFAVTAAATVSLIYKIPQNFKKLSYFATTGYAGAAGEVIAISIVGNNSLVNSDAFSYTQSLGTYTSTGAGDFTAGYTVTTPALYSKGGYYIKLTVTFANTGTNLRTATMIGLSDS